MDERIEKGKQGSGDRKLNPKRYTLYAILCLCSLLFAANEINYHDTTGLERYTRVVRPVDGYIWDADANAFAASPTWANTSIDLTEDAQVVGLYQVDFPTEVTALGTYFVFIYDGNATEAANMDTMLGWDKIDWDSGSEVAAIDNVDVHTWYVAKDGSDSAGGHTRNSSLLTIGQAVADACDGDTVIIWPGDYDEAITPSKCLNYIGTNRSKCRIARLGSNNSAMTLDVNCSGSLIKNLSIIGSAGVSYGLSMGSVADDVRLENVECYGSYDGLYAIGERTIAKDCYFYSQYDGANFLADGHNSIFEKCTFYTSSEQTGQPARALLAHTSRDIICRDCVFSAEESAGTMTDCEAVRVNSNITLVNCKLYVNATGSMSGVAVGLKCRNPSQAIVIGGSIIVNSSNTVAYGVNATQTDKNGVLLLGVQISNSGTGSSYDLRQANDGEITVVDCQYDTGSTSGIITQGGSGWAAAVNTEADTALEDYNSPTYAEWLDGNDVIIAAIEAIDANLVSDVNAALEYYNLDHLCKNPVADANDMSPEIVAHTFFAYLLAGGDVNDWDYSTDTFMDIYDLIYWTPSGGGF